MAKTAHGTLSISTVATVTLAAGTRGFRVKHRGAAGTADMWVTWGYNTAATPAVEAADTYNLAAGETLTEEDGGWLRIASPPEWTSTVFKLFSTGAVAYSVETW